MTAPFQLFKLLGKPASAGKAIGTGHETAFKVTDNKTATEVRLRSTAGEAIRVAGSFTATDSSRTKH